MRKTLCCFNTNKCTENITYIGGIPVCDYHLKEIRLFSSDTIKRQKKEYTPITRDEETYLTYEDDIKSRLEFVEKDYLKTKIKLLHILEQL